jgi:hypothetical protein
MIGIYEFLTANRSTSSLNQRANKVQIIDFLGGKCKWCAYDDIRALQIDHIFGTGLVADIIWKGKGKFGGGGGYYVRLLTFLKNNPNQKIYQCLCANCQALKRDINNENPKGKTSEITRNKIENGYRNFDNLSQS